jgi:uncharacterized protein (DUF2384 family)
MICAHALLRAALLQLEREYLQLTLSELFKRHGAGQMPNKRESIGTLVRAVKLTGLEMNNKITRFQNRGLSHRTIQALIADGIDAPERVLFMPEAQLRKIRGVSIRELRAYRARFTSDAR